MKKVVYTVYAKEDDLTFIMEDTYKDDAIISTEVKGFYYGEPKDKHTKEYYGELKADLSAELWEWKDIENEWQIHLFTSRSIKKIHKQIGWNKNKTSKREKGRIQAKGPNGR